MKRSRGYVFSLDAFVAFTLILISIQAMILMTSLPKGYQRALLQADLLARDTLQTLSIAEPRCPQNSGPCGSTYLELIYSGTLREACGSDLRDSCARVRTFLDDAIPPQYSYGLSFYDLSSGAWTDYYDASNDVDSTHYGITYRRVKASSQIFMIGYSIPLYTGRSPYCNVECRGWDEQTKSDKPPEQCGQVPCDVPRNNLDKGEFHTGLLRMTVWG